MKPSILSCALAVCILTQMENISADVNREKGKEYQGFRDILWGMDINSLSDKNFIFIGETRSINGAHIMKYRIENDDPNIEGIAFDAISYFFINDSSMESKQK
jgi:hypothetical protein